MVLSSDVCCNTRCALKCFEIEDDLCRYRYTPQITREAQLIEQEKMHINALLAEGKTRQEIASMGLYSALDPNVMGAEAAS